MKRLLQLSSILFAGALCASAQSTNVVTNLSACGTMGPIAGTLTTGFIINGSAAKSLLIRGAGPALATFGFATVAADVSLTVYDSNGNVVASNDGYLNESNSDAIAADASALGAFPLTSSGDSAILISLAPGSYTVQAAPGPLSQGDGATLVGVWDADVLSGTSSSTLVTNFSAMGSIGQGSAALTLGFVIGGTSSEQIYLHGVGPDLAQFGIANAASAVGINLYDAFGNLLATDNGFTTSSDEGELQSASTSLGDIALSNSGDSAVMVSLMPGAYTLTAVPSDGAANGVVLLEGYDADALQSGN